MSRRFGTIGIASLIAAALAMSPAAAQERLARPDWVDPTSDLLAPDVLVYYFHNTFRCHTCLSMESMAEEELHDDFDDDLQSGLVVWRAVNVQNPEQTHFAEQYGLDGPSLVLSEWRDGEEVRWKNLKRIWELSDDPVAYREYVRSELQKFLDEIEDGEATE